MRSTLALFGALCISGIIAAWGCSDGSSATTGASIIADGSAGPSADAGTIDPAGSGGGAGLEPAPCFGCGAPPPPDASADTAAQVIESMRIEPADATLLVTPGGTAVQPFRVLATFRGTPGERDITSRSVFYVPDNFLVGTFPLDGSPTFQTRLPNGPNDEPQRTGTVTIEAQATNADDSPATASTTLRVVLNGETRLSDSALTTDAATAAAAFTGEKSSTRAPRLVYPTDGVMFPPNIRNLDVHWTRGGPVGTENDLFELTFESPTSKIVYYTGCNGGSGYVANTCGLTLPATISSLVATSNSDSSVSLTIRGTKLTSPTPIAFGESTAITLNFASSPIEGGLYYWAISAPKAGFGAIMRVDFGAPNAQPETFLPPGENGLPACIGCHALSRDGSKLVASGGSPSRGNLVFLNDLSKDKVSPDWLILNGADAGAPVANRVNYASFNPDGSQFAAVYSVDDRHDAGAPETAEQDRRTLHFHDGTTGERVSEKVFPGRITLPDWSPDGTMIAVTRIADAAKADNPTVEPMQGGIEIIKKTADGWSDPETVVPSASGKNRFNPAFTPDSSIVLYTESTCPTGGLNGWLCDSNADPSSRIWAVKPEANATPVALTRTWRPAQSTDIKYEPGDTFARSAPFASTHRGRKITWATFASGRRPGNRMGAYTNALLVWMVALDPAKILEGQDGSYPAFFLPFQSFATSNQIAQWTQKVVGGNPAPRPPAPPRPAPPPRGPR